MYFFAVTFRYVSLQMDPAGFAINYFDQQPGVKTISGTKSLSLATHCLLLDTLQLLLICIKLKLHIER
jgi:hypothetical protein